MSRAISTHIHVDRQVGKTLRIHLQKSLLIVIFVTSCLCSQSYWIKMEKFPREEWDGLVDISDV